MRRVIFAVSVASLSSMGAAHAEDHEVSQRKRAFSPDALVISTGDRVTFKNDDTTPHHIKVTSGPVKFKSRLLPRGLDYTVPFNREGKWAIGCRIHPRMHMTIEVRAAPSGAVGSTDRR